MDDVITTLGPIIENGSRPAGLILTLLICWRLISWTWVTAVTTLRDSADYARGESKELRDRVDDLEQKTIDQAEEIDRLRQERAAWIVREGQLEHRVADLERRLAELTANGGTDQ